MSRKRPKEVHQAEGGESQRVVERLAVAGAGPKIAVAAANVDAAGPFDADRPSSPWLSLRSGEFSPSK